MFQSDSSSSALVGDSSQQYDNLSIAVSVSGNALTIALKNKAGADCSASSTGYVGFRNATATTGTYTQVAVTGALSVVVSSGSTLGTVSGVVAWLYVYLINVSGVAELAVSRQLHDDGSLISTTAEGGAGAADSGVVVYSTTTRAAVPSRLIGRMQISEATAGTWASAPLEVSNIPFSTQQVITDNSFSRIEACKITYAAGTPTITYQTGKFISSLTDTGTGQIGINLTAGYFNEAPVCVATSAEDGVSGSSAMVTGTSTSSVTVRIRDLAGSLVDESVWVIFFGTRTS